MSTSDRSTEPSRDASGRTLDSERQRVRSLSRSALFGDPLPIVAQRYALRERIGAGGLGVVYRAEDVRLRRDVALKFVRVPRSTGGEDGELFREALTLARLSHPNIVPVLDVGRLGNEIFIAMELLVGETLEARLSRGPLPWRSAVALVREVAAALAAAHSAGIVHGDVKPANVMVTQEGHARLLDFGLAQGIAEATRDHEPSANDGSRPPGTAGFLAPERHDGRCDPRTDQFALCVMLYCAIFGALPLGTSWARLRASDIDGITFSSRIGVPRSLVSILRRGLSYAPDERFPDMNTLVVALTRVATPRPRRLALGVAAIVTTFWVLGQSEEQCRFDPPLAELRDEDVRARLVAAEVGAPASELLVRLDGFETEWLDSRTRSCKALASEAISPLLYDLRTSCLIRTRDAIGYALVRGREPGFSSWAALQATIEGLAEVSACEDDSTLLEALPTETTDPDLDATIARGLDRAYVDQLLGDSVAYLEALLELERDHADLARAPHATLWLTAHIGSALNQRGRHAEAIERLRPALLAAEGGPRWRVVEGALLVALSEALAQGSQRGSEASFLAEQAIATFAGSESSQRFVAAGYRALAGAALAGGDGQAALDAIATARRYDHVPVPGRLAGLAWRAHEVAIANWEGLALEQLKRPREAEAAYRRGLAASTPSDARTFDLARVHNNLGLLLGDTGRTIDAREHLERATELKRALGLHDEAATTLMNLGNVLSRAGDDAAAISVYDEALAETDRPGVSARVRLNRAIALQQSGRLAEAIADYEFVLTFRPETPTERNQVYAAAIGLGLARLAAGDRVAAQADLEAALASEPANASGYDRAELRLGLARAVSDTAQSRAVALADEARAIATADGEDELADRARSWVRAHARR